MSKYVSVMCVVLAAGQAASADERTWINAAGGAYGVSSNWQNRQIPGGSDLATFSVGGQYVVSLGGSRSVQALQFLNGACTITGGQLDVLSVAIMNQFAAGVGNGGVLQLRNARLVSNTFHVGLAGRGYGGTVVSGLGAVLQSEVLVGSFASTTGQLVIENGGQVIGAARTPGALFDGWVAVGILGNGQGSVRVTGAGSLLRAPEHLHMGGTWWGEPTESRGTLLAEQNAVVEAGSLRVDGRGLTGGADVTIQNAGTRMTVSREFLVGNAIGSVSVLDGASLHAGSFSLGWHPWTTACDGIVRGSGSELIVLDNIIVGDQGIADLQVDQDSVIEGRNLLLGLGPTSEGVLSVDDGAQLTIESDVEVGRQGKGTWYAGAGCRIEVGGTFRVGTEAGSQGRATFDVGTAGALSFGGPWELGNGGRATVEVVGRHNLNLADHLLCGGAGQATLLLRDGASVSSNRLSVATQPGSTGSVVVKGRASGAFFDFCELGGTSSAGGAGKIQPTEGALVRIWNEVSMWPGGVLDGSGGTVLIGGTASFPRTKGVLLGSGGLLRGGGLVRGDLTVVSGTLRPSLPGSPITVEGLVYINRRVLAMETRLRTRPVLEFAIPATGSCTQLACGGFVGEDAIFRTSVADGVNFAAGQDYRFVVTPNPVPLLLNAPFSSIEVPNVGFASDGKWLWMWLKAEPRVGITGKVRLAGDFNCDGTVDDADEEAFTRAFSARDATTDLNSSGTLDANDIQLFAQLVANSR